MLGIKSETVIFCEPIGTSISLDNNFIRELTIVSLQRFLAVVAKRYVPVPITAVAEANKVNKEFLKFTCNLIVRF